MIKRIHHLGIAVGQLDEAARHYETVLGTGAGDAHDVPSARSTVQFFPVGESRIELIAPMDDDSPVARHLRNRGPGLHHICLEVDDIEAEVARMRAAGMRFVTDDIQDGAHGSRIIFLHPKSTGGVLIELQQAT
jgi:methylmalonyl-CoA/ethylmalonyl-CoA epimerase